MYRHLAGKFAQHTYRSARAGPPTTRNHSGQTMTRNRGMFGQKSCPCLISGRAFAIAHRQKERPYEGVTSPELANCLPKVRGTRPESAWESSDRLQGKNS